MKRVISVILLVTTMNLVCVEKIPEPYSVDEFHPLLMDVRRASIIFCGAFPLGYMYSSAIGDPFLADSDLYRDLDDIEKNNKQIETKLVSSLLFAGIVMILDFIIEKFLKG